MSIVLFFYLEGYSIFGICIYWILIYMHFNVMCSLSSKLSYYYYYSCGCILILCVIYLLNYLTTIFICVDIKKWYQSNDLGKGKDETLKFKYLPMSYK